MPTDLPTIAACAHCGAILLRTSRVLVHPMPGERARIQSNLGTSWSHHAHTRFDGRIHRCPGVLRQDREATARAGRDGSPGPDVADDAVVPRPKGWIWVSRGLGVLSAIAALCGQASVRASDGGAGRDVANDSSRLDRIAAVGLNDLCQPQATASRIAPEPRGGRYQVLETLRRGGGIVAYRARDRHLDTDVVLEMPIRRGPEAVACSAHFLRELRAMAKLAHPHLVKVTDVGVLGASPFAILEYLPGGSLQFRRPVGQDGRPAPMAPSEVAAWLSDLAGALDFLHAQGYLHRDVRPANILFDDQGRVYLGGLAMAESADARLVSAPEPAQGGAAMVPGAIDYVAPERIMGRACDGRADQYALAVIVFELLSGRRPFEGRNATATLVKQATREPPELTRVRPTISVPLSGVVQRALARDPGRRFPDCSAFARAFAEAARGEFGPEPARNLSTASPRSLLLAIRTPAAGILRKSLHSFPARPRSAFGVAILSALVLVFARLRGSVPRPGKRRPWRERGLDPEKGKKPATFHHPAPPSKPHFRIPSPTVTAEGSTSGQSLSILAGEGTIPGLRRGRRRPDPRVFSLALRSWTTRLVARRGRPCSNPGMIGRPLDGDVRQPEDRAESYGQGPAPLSLTGLLRFQPSIRGSSGRNAPRLPGPRITQGEQEDPAFR